MLLSFEADFFAFVSFLGPTEDQQVDGEALCVMNEATLTTLVPAAGIRAKLMSKIAKLESNQQKSFLPVSGSTIEVLQVLEDEPLLSAHEQSDQDDQDDHISTVAEKR